MNIAILGYGTVGKGVEKTAEENNINVSHILMRDIDELTKSNMCKSLDEILSDPDLDCAIECIGGDEPAFSYVSALLKAGKNVISSNKKMTAKHYKEILDLAKKNNVSFLFSSACGGAIPWICELCKISQSDELLSFSGIMNGTSNYVLSRVHAENSSFKDALLRAQGLGFAEQDPSDDIDGIDTANKCVLSMGAGFGKYVDPKNIFVRGIRNFDTEDLEFAKEGGYKCVLIGSGNGSSVYVMPRFVNEKSVFYSIKDNYNCFTLEAKNFGPFSMIGQGAGSLPTASNVIRDLYLLKDPYRVSLEDELVPDYDTQKHVFYIRSKEKIDPGFIEKKLANNKYITKKISINELKTIIHDEDFVGEISDD